jgi:hypothetical protein
VWNDVQRQFVAIAQQQMQVFKPALAAPLYDSDYISRMEEYVAAIPNRLCAISL